MNLEVREFLNQATLCRPDVERIAGLLPENDAELDSWIAETVRESDRTAFMLLVFAAFLRERRVDAHHLAGGLRLIGVGMYVSTIALRMQGDVAEYLLEGLRDTALYNEVHATALLSIAVWCDEHTGGVYPDRLIPEARAFARRSKHTPETDACLIELALKTNDASFLASIRKQYPNASDEAWQKIVDAARNVARASIEASRRPLLELVWEVDPGPLRTPTTLRRAAPRIGRNEPCHCGSGKKYKNCCYEKDRGRLQDSSDVAGLTQKELAANPERHLNLERLERMPPQELGQLDPTEIPRWILPEYFLRLGLFNLDRAAELVEKLGYADELEDSWFIVMWAAERAGRKDIGDRLMKLREHTGFTEKELRIGQRLLIARDDPAKTIQLIEEAAHNALEKDDRDAAVYLADAVAFSNFRALGILLYRGSLPLVSQKTATTYYEQMQIIRERLNLPPQDPIHELLDVKAFADAEEAERALREAEQKFEAKRREVRLLKEMLDQSQKELARRERASASLPESPAPILADSASEDKLRELRQKVKSLEADLKEKHYEHNTLERKLEATQRTVEALHERAQLAATAANEADAEAEREEELLLPQDAESNHPVRVIEFPRNFQERLNEFPHHVARNAMVILGRLAGGDAAAFNGAKRLKSRPNIMRQRVGLDFRLLFRLLPDSIQVIDLIPRQDFERRIKTLA